MHQGRKKHKNIFTDTVVIVLFFLSNQKADIVLLIVTTLSDRKAGWHGRVNKAPDYSLEGPLLESTGGNNIFSTKLLMVLFSKELPRVDTS